MKEKEIFQEIEVPYTQLQRLGLDKETLSHLPPEVSVRRTRQTLWSAVQMLTQNCC